MTERPSDGPGDRPGYCLRLGPGAPPDRIGGKARSLVRLAAAGFPVPEALVVTTDLFEALRAGAPPLPSDLAGPGAVASLERAMRAMGSGPWPAGFAETLATGIDTLIPDPGARFVVRSSAGMEDEATGLAAGLFLSRVDVARGEVLEAVRAVLGSALSPAVIAYLTQRGISPETLRFAVLIHPFVDGETAGGAAWDPRSPEPPTIEVHAGRAEALPAAARQRLDEAVRTLAASFGPVEIEWVCARGTLTFLQLRPYQRGLRSPPASGSVEQRSTSPDADLAADWHWDAAHNPLPLTPAQAGLVELVDRRCRIGLRQKVVGGYLFYVVRSSSEEGSEPSPDADPAEALRAVTASAASALARPAPTLETALETFVDVYRPLFGVVQPNARARRGMLSAFLRRHGFDPGPLLPQLLSGVPSAATERARLARDLAQAATPEAWRAALDAYLTAFGDEGPRWDVEAPTWREMPAALERLVQGASIGPPVGARAWRDAADALAARLPPEARAEWEERLSAARSAAGVAEDDDVLYARIQAHVRHALLREGARLVTAGALTRADEVFWLPLETLQRDARGERALGQAEAAALVAAARHADAEARVNPPPLGAAESAQAVAGAGMVRGRAGAPGSRIGRVHLHSSQEEPDRAQDQILVARTLLPTELPLLSPAAIVVETGGVLDHVAAQARERGIPAVVGASGAGSLLREGDQVLVDGDAGLVIRL